MLPLSISGNIAGYAKPPLAVIPPNASSLPSVLDPYRIPQPNPPLPLPGTISGGDSNAPADGPLA